MEGIPEWEMSDEQFAERERLRETLSREPHAWLDAAAALRRAADVLEEAAATEPKLTRIALMLRQMSYEDVLKAMILGRGSEPAKGHNLVRLAGKAGIELTPAELNQLHALTPMNGRGRYPHAEGEGSEQTLVYRLESIDAALQAALERG